MKQGSWTLIRGALLIVSLFAAFPAFAQTMARSALQSPHLEPQLHLGPTNFALPVVEYRAPDGTLKISQGIIIGRDVAPNTRVGLGLFKMKPKFDEDSGLPTGKKSRKVALGVSLRF